MQIEIYKTACSLCSGTFYELDGALDNCPHCEAETDEATTNDTLTATVEIDWRTGELKITGGPAVDEKWIVSTDEFEPTTQEFDDERRALSGYDEFTEERHYSGDDFRVYLAKVIKYSGGPSAWKTRKL